MTNRSYNNEKFLIKAAKKAGIKNIDFDDLYSRYDEHLAANYKLATELKLSGKRQQSLSVEKYIEGFRMPSNWKQLLAHLKMKNQKIVLNLHSVAFFR